MAAQYADYFSKSELETISQLNANQGSNHQFRMEEICHLPG
jgi:hypothetical protein